MLMILAFALSQRLYVSRLNGVVNRDLEDFDSWLKGNKLSLNVVKTQSMLRLKHFLGIAAEL